MDFSPGTYPLGYLAELLCTVSSCVLPPVTILLAAAVGARRQGPYAQPLGSALSFASLGVFLAAFGTAAGLEASAFRSWAAGILIGLAIVLLPTKLQQRFAVATSGLSNAGNSLLARIHLDDLPGSS